MRRFLLLTALVAVAPGCATLIRVARPPLENIRAKTAKLEQGQLEEDVERTLGPPDTKEAKLCGALRCTIWTYLTSDRGERKLFVTFFDGDEGPEVFRWFIGREWWQDPLHATRTMAEARALTLKLRQGMPLAEVQTALGAPDETAATTCGHLTKSPEWQCLIWKYRTDDKPLTVRFEPTDGGQVVNGWGFE